ncbi:DUF362 domain-containing protein [Candidatus Thorarchaeota archaeon]|nr:MAG: DUF362 domain-containing protein [Candidatus Thorarchaeota archaeon]
MEYTAEVAIGLRRDVRTSLSYALSKLTKPLETPKILKYVVVKPSIYDPKLVGNTNPNVVKAVICSFKFLGTIYVVESDNPLRKASNAFTDCGYDNLAEERVKLVNLSEEQTKRIEMPGHYFRDHPIPMLLQNGYVLINVPTVKLEPEKITIGAGIKNLFGLLPEVNKRKYHERIDDVLIDLLTIFRPHLTIVDLSKIVIGHREDGITREAGALLVGKDPVAVDAICADFFGIDPMNIPHLKMAYDLHLGEALVDRIRVIGTEEQKAKLFELCRL